MNGERIEAKDAIAVGRGMTVGGWVDGVAG
jgi:hypothetical protein